MQRTRIAAALTLAALASGLSAPARADGSCDTYGKLALQQQQDNERLKCGFTGPEWSSDLKGHLAWCSGVGPDQWRLELQKRAEQLATCKAK